MRIRPIDFEKPVNGHAVDEITVEPELSDDWARNGARIALDADPRALSGQIIVSLEEDRLEVGGELVATALRTCERCGEDVDLVVTAPLDLVYAPEALDVDGSDDEDDDDDIIDPEDDIDLGYYGKDGLDLGDVVCEALALALPARICCTDEAACDARTEALLREKGKSGDPGHPGFASLKKPR